MFLLGVSGCKCSLRYYLSSSLSLSIIQSHKHYNVNNIHQRYSIGFCCINKIPIYLDLAILNLNDKKTRNYRYKWLWLHVFWIASMLSQTTRASLMTTCSHLCDAKWLDFWKNGHFLCIISHYAQKSDHFFKKKEYI